MRRRKNIQGLAIPVGAPSSPGQLATLQCLRFAVLVLIVPCPISDCFSNILFHSDLTIVFVSLSSRCSLWLKEPRSSAQRTAFISGICVEGYLGKDTQLKTEIGKAPLECPPKIIICYFFSSERQKIRRSDLSRSLVRRRIRFVSPREAAISSAASRTNASFITRFPSLVRLLRSKPTKTAMYLPV